MCKTNSKTRCCQRPKELKDDINNCSKEQLKKCHGNTETHPCTKDKEER